MPPTSVPGLTRPVSISEYATLTGVREGEVLAAILSLKLPSAYSNGEWWIEAPPNSEARLAQVRSAKAVQKKEGSLVDWLQNLRAEAREQTEHDLQSQPETTRERTQSDSQPQRQGLRPNELPQRNKSEQQPAVVADASPVNVNSGSPQAAQSSAAARRPQPIDYGLTYDDLNLYDRLGQWWRSDDGNKFPCVGTRPDDKYKKGRRWFGVLQRWQPPAEFIGGLSFWVLFIGIFVAFSQESRSVGLIMVGGGGACFLFGFILPGILIKRAQQRASPALIAYWQAVDRYDREKAATEKAAREAAHDAEMRKRSYWTFLDGYGFERATAEVLSKHQFNAFVTPGSGDGGVDIQVTRNGLKGVVQCKAHMARCGPHVVRDLYGVINHTRACFGIIVSLGGFSKGAVEFARDKPILFVDLDDLIAMQEGKDVLAGAFTRTET